MWETGVIEDGYEKAWEPKHYALSCSVATIMVLTANLHAAKGATPGFLDTIFRTAIQPFGEKKDTFFVPPKEMFELEVTKFPEMRVLVEFLCSRCVVVPCLNRQAPFFNQKLFMTLVKFPEILLGEPED
jgi:hypothetical protein